MKTLISESKTKKVFQTDNSAENVIEFMDELGFSYSENFIKIRDKGVFSNQLCAHLYKLLSSYHISTFFLKKLSDTTMCVRSLKMIPVVVCIRNIAAGSLVEKFGLPEGKELECPLVEYYMKSEGRQNQIINEDHIISFGYASKDELKEIHRISSKVNVILKDFFRRRSFKLVDFKLEFGHYSEGRVMIGEEITLDTCNLLDMETGDILFSENKNASPEKLHLLINQLSEKLFNKEV